MKNKSRSLFALETFRLGGVLVEPAALRLSSANAHSAVEPKVMALIVALAQHSGVLMRREDLIDLIWPDGEGGDESLSRLISLLRKTLAQDHELVDAIATIPKLGYRLDAEVTQLSVAPPESIAADNEEPSDRDVQSKPPFRRAFLLAVVLAVLVALAYVISSNHGPAAAGSGGGDEDMQVSLAILPIENNTRASAMAFLAEGMTRDITARLSLVPDIRVAPYSSTRELADSTLDDIERLRVRYLVSGSLSEQGDDLLLRIDLTDTETQSQIWSKRFARPIEGFFDLQDQAVHEIATAVLAEIEASEIQRVRNRDDFDLDVYELIQKAEAERYRYGREPALRIVQLARRAIALDPDNRSARTLLATQLVLNATSRYSVDRERDLAEARKLIASLRSEDPRDPDVLAVAGQLALYVDGDHASARRLLSRALESNPNEAHVAAVLGLAICYQGEPDEGLKLLRQSEARAPQERRHSLWAWFRSSCLNTQSDFAGARSAMIDAIDRNPNYAHFQYGLAFVECMDGRPRIARRHIREAQRIDPKLSFERYRGVIMSAGYPGSPGMPPDRQFAGFENCLTDQ